MPAKQNITIPRPEKVFLELTTECGVGCVECRNAGVTEHESIDTLEWKDIIDDLSGYGVPSVVFTGGDPVLRQDLLELVFYASFQDMKVIIETNGTNISPAMAKSLKKAGVSRVDFSIDGSNAEKHDTSRGVEGFFTKALSGFQILRDEDIHTGFNTSVTSRNSDDLKSIIELAERLGARILNIFLMLPGSGCIRNIGDDVMDPVKCREMMNWLWNISHRSSLDLKILCSPQYIKLLKENRMDTEYFRVHHCPAAVGIAYVNCVGEVFPCPHIDTPCGNLRKKSFKTIWEKNADLQRFRSPELSDDDCAISKNPNHVPQK